MRTVQRRNLRLTPRPVRGSVEDLVAAATVREPLKTADSLSGSSFERLEIDGRGYVLKYLHVDDDWIQRAQGDLYTRPLIMWRSGLFDALPACVDHTIVDVAAGLGRNGWGAAVLMRDVSEHLVPVDRGSIPLEQHETFLHHMAALHAAFWGFEDLYGLAPMSTRYTTLTPLMAAVEAERGGTDPVPRMVPDGWRRFAVEAPAAADIVLPLLDDPTPLVARIARGPMTLVHSDWKAGNLGSQPDGRTILIDWAFPGAAPAPVDIAWYVAVNCELLPTSKEATLEAYRSALESAGVDTEPWWDEQLALALLGACVMLGWSKTGDELAWWERRVVRAARYLT